MYILHMFLVLNDLLLTEMYRYTCRASIILATCSYYLLYLFVCNSSTVRTGSQYGLTYLYNFNLIIRTQCTCTIFTARYRVVKLWILQWNILQVPVLYVHYSTIVDFRYVQKYSRAFAIKTDGTTLFIPQFFSYRRGTYKILWNSEWNNPHCLFQIIPLPGYYHRGTILLYVDFFFAQTHKQSFRKEDSDTGIDDEISNNSNDSL